MAQAFVFLATTIGSIVLTPLLENLIPQPPVHATTSVSIGIGLCATTADSCGGNTPGVTLWNERGQFIGETSGTSQIHPDDQPISILVEGRDSVGNDVAYVSVTNGGDDAICINLISVADSVGVPKSLSGDVFFTCGADWFPSSQVIDNEGSTPKCVWLDRNASNGLRFQALGFHTGSFGNFQALSAQYNQHPDSMCKSGPRLRMYTSLTTEDPILIFQPPITFNADGTDVDMSKIIGNPGVNAETAREDLLFTADKNYARRAVPLSGTVQANSTAAGTFVQGQVVISALEKHSAKEVCESSTSRGPDFVSLHEGQHCDMTTRTLYDVCSSTKLDCCFDAQTSQMRSCASSVRRRDVLSARSVPVKDYHTTHKWGWE